MFKNVHLDVLCMILSVVQEQYCTFLGKGNVFTGVCPFTGGGGGDPSPRFFPRSLVQVLSRREGTLTWPGVPHPWARGYPGPGWGGTPYWKTLLATSGWGTPQPGPWYPLLGQDGVPPVRTGLPTGQVRMGYPPPPPRH